MLVKTELFWDVTTRWLPTLWKSLPPPSAGTMHGLHAELVLVMKTLFFYCLVAAIFNAQKLQLLLLL